MQTVRPCNFLIKLNLPWNTVVYGVLYIRCFWRDLVCLFRTILILNLVNEATCRLFVCNMIISEHNELFIYWLLLSRDSYQIYKFKDSKALKHYTSYLFLYIIGTFVLFLNQSMKKKSITFSFTWLFINKTKERNKIKKERKKQNNQTNRNKKKTQNKQTKNCFFFSVKKTTKTTFQFLFLNL